MGRIKFDIDTMKVKVCAKCRGLGIGHDLKGNRFDCPVCDGRGRIVRHATLKEIDPQLLGPGFKYDSTVMKIKVCKTCSGLGHQRFGTDERLCDKCGGSGRYIEQRVEKDLQFHEVEGLDTYNIALEVELEARALPSDAWQNLPATERQKAVLRDHDYPYSQSITRGEASEVIGIKGWADELNDEEDE